MSPHDPLDGERWLDHAPADAQRPSGSRGEVRHRPVRAPQPSDLPPLLGLGYLDPDTIRMEGASALTADYTHPADQLVYRVRWKASSCLLEEFERNRRVRAASARDLPAAVRSLASRGGWRSNEDPFWRRVSSRVGPRGRVDARRLPDELRLVAYPAIGIALVRIILPADELFDPVATWQAGTYLDGSPFTVTFRPKVSVGALLRPVGRRFKVDYVGLFDYRIPAIFVGPALHLLWRNGYRSGDYRREPYIGPYIRAAQPALTFPLPGSSGLSWLGIARRTPTASLRAAIAATRRELEAETERARALWRSDMKRHVSN